MNALDQIYWDSAHKKLAASAPETLTAAERDVLETFHSPRTLAQLLTKAAPPPTPAPKTPPTPKPPAAVTGPQLLRVLEAYSNELAALVKADLAERDARIAQLRDQVRALETTLLELQAAQAAHEPVR